MKKTLILALLIVCSSLLTGQVVLLQEGTIVNNSIAGFWAGVNIPRAVPTNLSYLNNSVTSVNASGYLLQAGDEVPLSTNNNLNGAVITGNKLTWNGTDPGSITHGMFLGYNINYTVKYNYLHKTPYGILFKSGTDAGSNMNYSPGYGAAYNIIKDAELSLRMKGINGVQVYNNTFYSGLRSGSLILIDANRDRSVPAPSTGAKIKNNIFYTVYQIFNIAIESGCLTNFESDYNVFYCESGAPMFSVNGVSKTFAQWQAMGYDLHSVVVNPNFTNLTDFIPGSRLNYGTNLGTTWQTGLSTTAKWIAGSAPATTNQNGTWQVGAVIYTEVSAPVPASPVYVSSAVENTNPGVLEMIYNLSLAPVSPAAVAFSVTVNSVARNINSVTVSGTKVLLSLTTPVLYGDIVTVAYSKPATNPLQTTSGGQAATISAQLVTNKVAQVSPPPVVNNPVVVNTPPVVVINSPPTSLSGFVEELDATGSYDINKDILSYNWIVPGNISVSATNSSKIQFLGPVVSTPQQLEFRLNISDGKSVQSKSVMVEIVPYKPELEAAEIISIEESGFQAPYYPHNILDGDIGTMWSANGDNQWLIVELSESFTIQHVKLAFQPGQKGESYFDILGSEDKVNWEPVLIKSSSCGFSGDLQVFDFPPSKTGKEYKFVKLVGRTNSFDSWNYISEFKIFGFPRRNPSGYDSQAVKIYPNPAQEFVNIRIDDVNMKPDYIKIISFSGEIVFHDKINNDTAEFQIPLDLKNGIYIVQMGSGHITFFTQKLIVNI